MQGLRSTSMEMYIKSSEAEFGMDHKDLDSITDKELMKYIDYLDELHDK